MFSCFPFSLDVNTIHGIYGIHGTIIWYSWYHYMVFMVPYMVFTSNRKFQRTMSIIFFSYLSGRIFGFFRKSRNIYIVVNCFFSIQLENIIQQLTVLNVTGLCAPELPQNVGFQFILNFNKLFYC